MKANREHGITSAVDARTYWQRGYLKAYEKADGAAQLTTRMSLSLWASPLADDDAQLAQLAKLRADHSAFLRANMVKVYDDGLLDNTTAALLSPYVGKTLVPGNTGLNYFIQARLQKYVAELQQVGFRLHVHAISDRAVHEALNAIETAATSKHGHGHRLTHVEMIQPSNIVRFAALGVAAAEAAKKRRGCGVVVGL